MALFQTSPGLICVTHFSSPVADVHGDHRARCLVCSRGSSVVGCRGAVVGVGAEEDRAGCPRRTTACTRRELVAGPKWKMCSPQPSLIVTGGSSGSGLGPTSYFQTTLPVSGSRATTKPRPVQPRCRGSGADGLLEARRRRRPPCRRPGSARRRSSWTGAPPGNGCGPRVDLPPLLAGGRGPAREYVAADVADVDRVRRSPAAS